MKTLSILNKNTNDIVATAKFNENLKSGQIVTYEDDCGNKFEGKVSFAKKWNAEKYHNVQFVVIV